VTRVRMRDVAAHAGVSPRTVSNVVSGNVNVSPSMRARVQKSLDELGYKMDYLARGLKSGRTGFIALVVPNLNEAYHAQLAQAVTKAAAERGLGVLVEATDADPATELKIMREGTANIADGVLLNHLGHMQNVGYQPPAGFPLVVLGQPGVAHADQVGVDHVAVARMAVEHLIERGRRRIAMIGAGFGECGQLRYTGYLQTLAAASIQPIPGLRPYGMEADAAAGKAETDDLLSRAAKVPDAIFAYNSAAALGVLRSLTEHGLQVPGDVAVIGVDDTPVARYMNPSLSVIAIDMRALATRALDHLEEQLKAPPGTCAPRYEVIPCHLVARESTAPPQ
jgi:DNA-binding LacI/PurR family transcriptional regulator